MWPYFLPYFLCSLLLELKSSTLISLINVKSRLPILKNSTLYKKKSTPHVYWFLRLFPSSTPPLLELCASIFRKIPPSMFIPTSTFIREMRVLVWTIQPTELNTCMHLYCCNFEQTWTRIYVFSNFLTTLYVISSVQQEYEMQWSRHVWWWWKMFMPRWILRNWLLQ